MLLTLNAECCLEYLELCLNNREGQYIKHKAKFFNRLPGDTIKGVDQEWMMSLLNGLQL